MKNVKTTIISILLLLSFLLVRSQNLYVGYPNSNQVLNINSGIHIYDSVFVLNNGTLNISDHAEFIVNDLTAIINTGNLNIENSNVQLNNILSIQNDAQVSIKDTIDLSCSILALDSNSILNIDSAFINLSLNYVTQYHWFGKDNSIINIKDSEFDFSNGSIEINLIDNARIYQERNTYTSAIVPLLYNLSDHSQVYVNSCFGGMEMTITENSSININESYPFILWYMFKDGDSADYNYPAPNSDIFPGASNISNYHFSASLPNVNYVNFSVDITNCDGVYWGVIPKENTDITINNSEIIACGFYFSGISNNHVTGLVNNQLYGSYTAPLSDRSFTVNNTIVRAWNFYPSDTTLLTIDNCLFGETIAFINAKVDIINSTCDGTGGHFSAGGNTAISVYNSNIVRTTALNNSIVVCRENGKAFFHNSLIDGKITVADSGNLILGNTYFTQAPVVSDNSYFAYAWVDSINNAAVNSSVSIAGSIWDIKGSLNNSNITRYIIECSNTDSTGFATILDTTASTFNIFNSQLGNWNTQGLSIGNYLLWLTIFVDGDSAISCNRTIFLDSNIGIETNKLTEEIVLYPNPSNGIFSVDGTDIKEIMIYDSFGVLIYEANSKYVKIFEYKKGVYYALIKAKNGALTKKIILL